jgi:hypothetical protein
VKFTHDCFHQDISDNRIADIEDVQKLRRLPYLRALWLDGNPVIEAKNYRVKVLASFQQEVLY